MSRWLLLDVNYLCHRAYHAMGELSHAGEMTGVVYGVFKDIIYLQERFATKNIVFCFDHGRGLREQVRPTYKAPRREKQDNATPEEKEGVELFRIQVKRLRLGYLPALGYKNIFYERGYEADDIIASVHKYSLSTMHKVIIVSSDQDLYQLIDPGTAIYSPSSKKLVTWEMFTDEWGITPNVWPWAKAIAGCPSDNVIGVKGVGLKTAIKYLQKTLKEESAAYKAIKGQHKEWEQNLSLVTLPYQGCPNFKLQRDETSVEKWRYVCKRLGFESLLGVPPKGVKQGGFGVV